MPALAVEIWRVVHIVSQKTAREHPLTPSLRVDALSLNLRATGKPQGRGRLQVSYSAHRFLHKRADPCLLGGGQLRQRERGWPHSPFVEACRVVEAEGCVPRVELLRGLEEADDLVVPGIRGHPIPGFRREDRRADFDDFMYPRGHSAIWFRHLGNLREHIAFPLCSVLVGALLGLQLSGALLHRGALLVCKSLSLLIGSGRLLRPPLFRLSHKNLLRLTCSHVFPLKCIIPEASSRRSPGGFSCC